MRTIEKNGESELEEKLLTLASRGISIKTEVAVVEAFTITIINVRQSI